MRPSFGASIKQVHEFAAKAAYDDEFRAELEENPREVMLRFGVDIPEEEIPEVRTLPSKAHCAAMLAMMLEYDSFADGEYDPVAISGFLMVYGFAMPLVATVEGSSGAR